jgi:photosystem II stability/assembly factor-like uncharacterized protein
MRPVIVLMFSLVAVFAKGQTISVNASPGDSSSFRGLSVVDNNVAWIGGSHGGVALTTDGGKNWTRCNVAGYGKAEFRSVYGFSAAKAIIANSIPASILITSDGGKSWRVVYSNDHPDAFIDGIDFWNEKDGVIYGDPIDGSMLLLSTSDGGETWQMVAPESRPSLIKGEASFAASGTGIRCLGKDDLYIASGGVRSRLFISRDRGNSWSVLEPPVIQGEQGTGIFSVAVLKSGRIVIVGGNFEKPDLAQDHVFYSDDEGKTWKKPDTPTRGYRECVEEIGDVVLATGTSGVDISTDGGVNWKPLSSEEFHVVKKARKGNAVILGGSKGRTGVLIGVK